MEEKEKTVEVDEEISNENLLERLKVLAEKQKKSVEDFLVDLEKKQEIAEMNSASKNRSTGSLKKNSTEQQDPASVEFLKGIWNK